MDTNKEEYKRLIELKTKGLDEVDSRIALFHYIQNFLYKVGSFKDGLELLKNGYGDCRHKHTLLFKFFSLLGLRVKMVKILFDWRDLPLPLEILSLLKESDTIWGHDALLMEIEGKDVLIDATWDPALKKYGFPVTDKWDGFLSTKPVTAGKIKILELEDYKKIKPTIKIIHSEAERFALSLNEFLDNLRNNIQ